MRFTGVSVELWPGETLGLVGESGSGKTTFARVLLGITKPDADSVVVLDDHELPGTTGKRSRDDIRSIQIVFQNPDQALNQRHAVKRIVGRALERLAGLHGRKRDDRMLSLTRSVRLADRYLSVRPASLSGGLKQRVAIARAFAGNPRIVVCDEPTSALDVSVQAAILNLLGELQRDEQTSYIFISHDLGVVRYLSDRIAVLYLGRLMEVGPAERVFDPAAPPVHRGAALGGSDDRRRRAAAHPPRRGHPERSRPTVRVRLPHPLPPPARRDLRHGGAAPRRGRAGALHALPHSDRRASPASDRAACRAHSVRVAADRTPHEDPDQPLSAERVVLTSERITVEELARVALDGRDRGGRRVRLGRECGPSRAVVERALERGKPVYGLNTGLGPWKDQAAPLDSLIDYQRRIVFERAGRHGPRPARRARPGAHVHPRRRPGPGRLRRDARRARDARRGC